MKNYYDRTWKIGELAKMFDINVQLLRHYDKEGLLVPGMRNPDNNWRTYRYDQIYPLGMIRFLRQLDCSLDDIGSFMPERNVETSEEYLKSRMKAVREKYEKLLNMEAQINDRFALINREMKYAESNQMFVYSEEEIYYIEIGGIEDIFVDELFYLYPTLVFYNDDEVRFAVKVPKEELSKFDRYSERLTAIPQGEYLVGFHKGPHERLGETFSRMEQGAEGLLDEGCRLDDTKICMDIVDQFIEADREKFITKVMIRIIRD